MKIVKTYKFKVYPTKEQQELINKIFGSYEFVYNFCKVYQKKEEDMWKLVSEIIEKGYFLENNYKSKLSDKNKGIKFLTELKKTYPWLKEMDNTSLQSSIENLISGYYKKKSKLLKFKSNTNKYYISLTCKNFKVE